jgi:SAM-dependent methyltransferase
MSDAERTKWDARYREQDAAGGKPSPFLVSLDPILPHTGRALDVAGGAGRHAVFLALRGLDVTIADISRVGLDLAEEEARRAGVRLTTVALDLEREPLPEGPWDVILSFHYLNRPLFAAYPGLLSPGGRLLVVHPTRSNLLRHQKPSGQFLLEDGELPGLVPGLTVVRYEEGWLEEGRHEARLVAMSRGAS